MARLRVRPLPVRKTDDPGHWTAQSKAARLVRRATSRGARERVFEACGGWRRWELKPGLLGRWVLCQGAGGGAYDVMDKMMVVTRAVTRLRQAGPARESPCRRRLATLMERCSDGVEDQDALRGMQEVKNRASRFWKEPSQRERLFLSQQLREALCPLLRPYQLDSLPGGMFGSAGVPTRPAGYTGDGSRADSGIPPCLRQLHSLTQGGAPQERGQASVDVSGRRG